ncbi:MAG: hypothetical protein ACJARN_000490, partial [Arenicella sp.]
FNLLIRNVRKYIFASTISGLGLLSQRTRTPMRGSRAG